MATNIEAIGNYIKEMKSTTALNASNNLVAQPQLINSSTMNSIDENKKNYYLLSFNNLFFSRLPSGIGQD
jgi:hypothetical protein